MANCRHLECFVVRLQKKEQYTPLEYVMDGVSKGLFKTRSWKRSSLLIKIHATHAPPSSYDCQQLAMKVLNLVHWLQASDIQSFMLTLELHKDVCAAIAGFPDSVMV